MHHIEDFFLSDPTSQYQSQRKATIRDAIAQRLRKVCSDLPEPEFHQLVEEMADRQLKGERRPGDL